MKKSEGKIKTTATVHKLLLDLRKALETNLKTQATWNDVTPLARNEWICWILSAKKTKLELVV